MENWRVARLLARRDFEFPLLDHFNTPVLHERFIKEVINVKRLYTLATGIC
jgi:hypothetical protein